MLTEFRKLKSNEPSWLPNRVKDLGIACFGLLSNSFEREATEKQPLGFAIKRIMDYLVKNPTNIDHACQQLKREERSSLIESVFPEATLGFGKITSDVRGTEAGHRRFFFYYDELSDKVNKKRKGLVSRKLTFLRDRDGNVEEFTFSKAHEYDDKTGQYYKSRVQAEAVVKDGKVTSLHELKEEKRGNFNDDFDAVEYHYYLDENGHLKIDVQFWEFSEVGYRPKNMDFEAALVDVHCQTLIKKFPPTDYTFLFHSGRNKLS